MKRTIGAALFGVVLGIAWQGVRAQPQAPPPTPDSAPTVAFDITKADIDYVLKNAPANPPDRQLRVVNMGKYNLGVGVPNEMNGPSGGGTAGAGAYSRRVQEGDIIIIPNNVAHGWSQITDHVTY